MPKPKKSVQKASVMSGSANFDDDDIMEMDDLIEESLDDEVGDMLESNNEAMQIEHVEVKDPKMEEADKQIEKELENIPAKFDKTAEKKPAKRPASSARPTTAKAPAKKAVAATKKPVVPSEKDILNQKKAAARASSKAKTIKAEAAPKPGPPKKKVDAEKLK